MNDNLLISVIANIRSVRENFPGKKELQKIVYLLQHKGLNTDYSYRFYFYGPYSDELDEDVQRLAIKGKLSISYDEMTHRIVPCEAEQQDVLEPQFCDYIKELDKISTSHLELMTTILYLFDNGIISGNPLSPKIVDEVILKVIEVKNHKYSKTEISEYFNLLLEKSYLKH